MSSFAKSHIFTSEIPPLSLISSDFIVSLSFGQSLFLVWSHQFPPIPPPTRYFQVHSQFHTLPGETSNKTGSGSWRPTFYVCFPPPPPPILFDTGKEGYRLPPVLQTFPHLFMPFRRRTSNSESVLFPLGDRVRSSEPLRAKRDQFSPLF